MNEFLGTLLQAVITAVVPVITAFLVKWLNALGKRTKEELALETADYYIDEALRAVTDAILYTSQTYVDGVKEDGKWDSDSQATALRTAVNQAKTMLSKDASDYIETAYGDINKFIAVQVEAQIKRLRGQAV